LISQRQLFLSHVAQTSPAPLLLEIVSASGVYLQDINGKKYIDLIAGISVSNIGHCHPTVVKAVQEQAEKFMHLLVYGEYVYAPQTLLAKALCDVLPTQLDNVYLVNSGTEATEAAIKLVKRYSGRAEIISFKKSYHGSTTGALSLMGDEYFKENFRPLMPGTKQIDYGKLEALESITRQTAAVFFEPIQAESGISIPSIEYVQALRKRCDEMGALLVFDEIQTGFGRTGKLFCFEHYDVVPDVLLLAKGMGGGMPIGAFIANKSIMHCLSENPVLGHITTFGGHPVTAAAALANLNVLCSENIIDQVETKGRCFDKYLHHQKAISYRRKGLMIALQFADFETNKKIIDDCIAHGVITDWFLFAPDCLRIGPPLIINENEIEQSCAIINNAMTRHL